MRKLFFTAVIAVACAAPVCAANITTATYLMQGGYPDQEAFGGCGAAAVYGNSAAKSNPAALAGAENFNYDAMQAFLPGYMMLQQVSLSRAFDFGAFGAGISYYNLGSFPALGIDANLLPVASVSVASAYSAVVSLGYGRRMSNFSIGVALKGMYEELAGDGSFVPLMDAGFVYDGILSDRISVGASMLDISPEDGGFAPPVRLKAGAAWYLNGRADKYVEVRAGAEYMVREGSFRADAGISYTPFEALTLRGGVTAGNSTQLGLSGGFGIAVSGITLNYSYTPGGAAGGTHSISVSGGGADRAVEEAAAEKPEKGGSYDSYRKSGDYYYDSRSYRQAVKYYEYINLLYWKEVEQMDDKAKSNFYQRLGICYYNMRDSKRALSYFDRALFYDRENEILKHWIRLLKAN